MVKNNFYVKKTIFVYKIVILITKQKVLILKKNKAHH